MNDLAEEDRYLAMCKVSPDFLIALLDVVDAAHGTQFVAKDAFFAGQVEGVSMTAEEFNVRMKPLHEALARFGKGIAP
jgi:hypothetical protein